MKAVKLLTLLCLALILLTLGLRIVYPFRQVPPQSSSDDPRLTYATPFTNVRPGVHYVGDSVCAQCHLDQAQTFAKHSMGQSLAPASAKLDVERLDPAAHNPFDAAGLHYEIEVRDGHLLHREVCLDAGGRPAASVEAEVSYVLGSGARGRSYLVEREGRLFQSPISWYGQKKIWDLAPSYVHENEHFERPISAGCLFCHSNAASLVEDTVNHYETPIFHSYAIGCERCHGPGELHVQLRQGGQPVTGVDHTVVNPAQLQPDLREAVCQPLLST